ncbi:MAG TPA: hypothetical protein VGD65_22930 [Chryseosolibacter sp.]
MKPFFPAIFLITITMSCQENEPVNKEFTGNETTYALLPGSAYNVSGSVTLREKVDGFSLIVIQLSGTEGDIEHPVHLHVGNIETPNAAILALLNPVIGKTGMSETDFYQLSDERNITYQELIHLDASIKVHLAASGPEKDIVLAAGNIGSNIGGHEHHGGRKVDVAVCQSE